MIGMDASNGKALDGLAHLHQSVRDILSTPKGSRVMRREYGSDVFRLIDAPMNRDTLMNIYAAGAEAIARWEPRLSLTKIHAIEAAPGAITLEVTGVYLPDGRTVTLDGIKV